jgi:transposase
MAKRKAKKGMLPAEAEGARRATGDSAGGATQWPLKLGQRWTRARKLEVVMRMFRGESMEGLSRELGVETYLLEEWREKAIAGIEEGLRERQGDPLVAELDGAMKRIGELSMANELLLERCRKQEAPFRPRRWKR